MPKKKQTTNLFSYPLLNINKISKETMKKRIQLKKNRNNRKTKKNKLETREIFRVSSNHLTKLNRKYKNFLKSLLSCYYSLWYGFEAK